MHGSPDWVHTCPHGEDVLTDCPVCGELASDYDAPATVQGHPYGEDAETERILSLADGEARAENARLARSLARTRRALEQGQHYGWTWGLSLCGRKIAVCRSASGAEYVLTLTTCSCPDYTERLAHTGEECKHLIAMSPAIPAGTVLAV